MSSAKPLKKEAVVKAEADSEVKIEQCVFGIDDSIEVKPDLATVRPLKLEVNDFTATSAEPIPSTSRAVAEVRVGPPPPAPFKFESEDPFSLAPRASRSPPPPPADRAKRRSVPGGHESARPRLKYWPYQHRR